MHIILTVYRTGEKRTGGQCTVGGFGGCTVSIVKNDAVDTFINTIGPAYKEKVGHEAEFYTVDIGSGAQKLETL